MFHRSALVVVIAGLLGVGIVDVYFPLDIRADSKPFGIEKLERPTSSKVIGFPDRPPPFAAERVLGKYRPQFPICVVRIPGTREMLTITQPSPYAHSAIYRFTFDNNTTDKDAEKVIDTPHRGTAYDICFHPKWKENGYIYVGWNGETPGRKGKWSIISRYTLTTKPPFTIDAKTEQTIIEWASDGHNGCAVCFGGDGMLYATSGDGTADSDTNLMGQRADVLLAKVLRIDVDNPTAGKQYSVPKDNPFVGKKDFAPETWALGLRNPWRITYDAKTDQLWVGQNGQDLWEQAYLVKKGENYGWSVMEGSHPFYPDRKAAPVPFTKPTVEHHHSEARSLTGGVVYQGAKHPELRGAYIYGDYSTGHIWAVKHTGEKIEWHKKIAITTLKITGFALDPEGELLICHHAASGDGGYFTLVPNTAIPDQRFPKKLSESGLFESVKEHSMKPGVIPYSVNAELWSDGAYKARFMALPEGTIDYRRNNGWEFPDKAVLVKSFALDLKEGEPASRKWIETRFLTKQNGEWYGYSYEWNADGTDASLVSSAGLDRDYTIKTATGERKQVWHYPGRAECMVCHSRAANYALGLSEIQMNRDHLYPGGRTDNQLRVLEHLGLLKLPSQPLKKLANPYDKSEPLEERVRAYLHVNCSNCHVEAGGGNAQMKLDYPTTWDKMRLIDVKPLHNAFGLTDARLIAPGAPERSVLVHRMTQRGRNSGQMPPLATNYVDSAGVELLSEWCKRINK